MPSLARLFLRAVAGSITKWLAPKTSKRMYGAARMSRTTGGFGTSNTSADAELNYSLTIMRSRSRQMVRDSPFAKRAKQVVVNNVIGSGVGVQAQVSTTRGELAKRTNDDIEANWATWCEADSCHTGGTLHFSDMERALMGQVFEAGEILVRVHFVAMGSSKIPLSLEVIEPERLAHEAITPLGVAPGNELRMGIEVNSFGRPAAYWVRDRHGGDLRLSGSQPEAFERVPAENMFHLRFVDRWPQTRGEPWMHPVLRKLDEMNEYTGLEVTAARGSASYFATITTPEPTGGFATETEDDGKAVMSIEPLTVQELAPGEELQFHSPNRPNSALDQFMRAMLREVAAGTGTSYESLSRDYSQSNYSSSRLALMDDRDLYKATQQWWIRSFRKPLHKLWIRQAVYSRAVSIPIDQYALNPSRFESALFKPRGWSWVDPAKEVAAYKEAIKAGLTTATDVIAATADGRDIEDVIATRKRELEMFEEAGILTDTEVVPEPVPGAPAEPASKSEAEPDDDDKQQRIKRVA